MSSLTAIIQSAAHLLHIEKPVNSTSQTSSLKAVLEERLRVFYTNEGRENEYHESDTLEAVQLTTAIEALSVVEKANTVLLSDPSDTTSLGTRDWKSLRTLISLVFNWGTAPLLASVCETWSVSQKASRKIVEVNDDAKAEDHRILSQLTTRLMTILFPHGLQADITHTAVVVEIAERHTASLLKPALTLGWLPRSLSTAALPVVDHLRPFTMRLLSMLSPALVISSLGSVLSSQGTLPSYVTKTTLSFLANQLLRPGGVLGLCESVFGQEETQGGDAPFDKLQKVSRTLLQVPTKMEPSGYYRAVIPKIIQLLSENTPPSYRKVAAFTLSQMLGSDNDFAHKDITSSLIHSILLRPFFLNPPSQMGSAMEPFKASVALSRLLVLIANCDPSPEVITGLLSPIVQPLYSFLFHLSKQKASDPQLREIVHGLLATWGKIVDVQAANGVFWRIIEQGERLNWKTDPEGNFYPCDKEENASLSDLLLPEGKGGEELDINTNLFDFYPDPVHFVSFLKSLDRGDIVSELFIRLLEAYRDQRMKGRRQDPMKTLHYLQIVMQMQVQLLDDTSASILKQPIQLLTFIKQVLESSAQTDSSDPATPARVGMGLADLRILGEDSDDDDDVMSEADSDDDDPDSEVIKPDDELLETALNLLLSVMESHSDLSVRQTPLLNDIFELLEPLSFTGSSSIRALAREARMVITARSASTSTMQQRSRKGDGESSQEKYQKALKLLQDPILPVRAHGLMLLRELVTPRTHKGKSKDEGELSQEAVDPALVPAILSVFLQSVQDEDSYIFLNGVQGLAAMVDGFGKEVFSNLVREYSDGLERNGTMMNEQELNIRVRIGEALGIVIRKCGLALGKYRDTLIPALYRVFRLRDIPVTLRTSSLSLLADAIDTCPLAMLPFLEDLAQGMIDLLQTETQPSATESPQKKSSEDDKEADEKPKGDNDHLATNSKYPPLRRAALHLLGLLIRSTVRTLDEQRGGMTPFSGNFVKRARITLGYVASTDVDGVARVMAREIREELVELESYILG